MVDFLAKKFIPHYKNYENPKVRHQYGILSGILGLILNFILFLFKIAAGFFSHSIAIMADAFNNLSDAGSAFITLIGFKLASEKPDKNHPYGYGRFEYITGLVVSFLILLMAFELFQSSIHKIFHPEETEISFPVLMILLLSILGKLYMAHYNRELGEKIHSAALLATAIDSKNDCFSTAMILISSIITATTEYRPDAYIGLIVSILIFISGIEAAKDTINPLLGQAPDHEFVERIENLVCEHDLILGVHDMLVHDYGPGRVMISLHAEVPSDGDLLEMHDLIDHIEKDISKDFNCEVVIHMDPVLVNDPETDHLKTMTSHVIERINKDLQFHDFRIVKGPSHTNLIFDVLVPYQFEIGDEDLIDIIHDKIKEIDSHYETVIKIDHIAI